MTIIIILKIYQGFFYVWHCIYVLQFSNNHNIQNYKNTLSIWARIPSWLLCLVVSRTKSFAWLAICSNKDPWEPCRRTPFPVTLEFCLCTPSLACFCPPVPNENCRKTVDDSLSLLLLLVCRENGPVPKLDALAKTLPTLGWRWRLAALGCIFRNIFKWNIFFKKFLKFKIKNFVFGERRSFE